MWNHAMPLLDNCFFEIYGSRIELSPLADALVNEQQLRAFFFLKTFETSKKETNFLRSEGDEKVETKPRAS